MMICPQAAAAQHQLQKLKTCNDNNNIEINMWNVMVSIMKMATMMSNDNADGTPFIPPFIIFPSTCTSLLTLLLHFWLGLLQENYYHENYDSFKTLLFCI